MKLYYEFMIKENLHKIKQWRDFKKKKNKEQLLEHVAWKKTALIEKKID